MTVWLLDLIFEVFFPFLAGMTFLPRNTTQERAVLFLDTHKVPFTAAPREAASWRRLNCAFAELRSQSPLWSDTKVAGEGIRVSFPPVSLSF